MTNPYREISSAAQRATLRAMGTIATMNGTREPKDPTRRMIEASAVQLFGLTPADVDYEPITPAELADELGVEDPISWLIDLMSLVPFADEDGYSVLGLSRFCDICPWDRACCRRITNGTSSHLRRALVASDNSKPASAP